jgi:hypothetical protein
MLLERRFSKVSDKIQRQAKRPKLKQEIWEVINHATKIKSKLKIKISLSLNKKRI